jgi:valyl-tRNA synthetase
MKHYDAQKVEEKIGKFWDKEKIYKFDPKSKKKIYSIDIPPSTISGRLHMGHAFGDSQQDFFARYKRMVGFNVLNPFGTDNNGLPTLRLIEKEKKVSSRKMKREEFIELCNKTLNEEFIPSFIEDAKKLGISADYEIFYSTIDKRSRRISQWSFIDLYKKGREYRIDSPALWCTECQTTIAQVELEDEEIASTFNDVVFKVDGKDLLIATTRPELLPACVSVFINPKDKKRKNLIGKKAKVPLFDFEVPILEDEKADLEKGTGIVMCCTFGDQNDMEWQKEYKLPIKIAISSDGKMTDISGKYKGLKIKDAREKIIKDLKDKGLLKKQEKISHSVNVHERCGTEIEFIKKKQWFIKYLDLKKEMLKWGSEVKWYPAYMKSRYDNWVKGLKWDWCISRQIAFGIPFPIWYCKNCDEIILADEKQLPVDPIEDKPPVKNCPKCKSKEFIPETDVMNTWATSALTPTIVKDLLKDTPVYNKIKNKPMSIRRNGHDIITFWDFNSIVKSQLHYGFNPWKELFINGWILGLDGKKMSKSKGNAIAPQEIMEKYGADVLRYLSASSGLGEDIAFPEKELVAGKKFINKLFNASKFVFMNVGTSKPKKPKKLEAVDKLFLQELTVAVNNATSYFEKYEYSKAKLESEKFFWKDFCDNYLEIVKKRVYQGKGNEKLSAQYTLYKSLLIILKMIAPITPFITEEIYQTHYRKHEKEKSIHLCEWPETKKAEESKEWNALLMAISTIRYAKTKAKKPMNSEIILELDEKIYNVLKDLLGDLASVVNAREIKKGKSKVEFK